MTSSSLKSKVENDFAEEWSNYFYSFRYRQPPKARFIYWAQPRSGSHLFADLLNTHPDICCVTEHELLSKRRGICSPYRYIDGVSKQIVRREQVSVFGGKVTLLQLSKQKQTIESVIAKLHVNGWKFIVLWRKNLLEQAISSQVARQRQQYHDAELPRLEAMQIEVDLALLHHMMARKDRYNQQIRNLLAPYNVLTVNYENDLIGQSVQQKTANRIFEFLSVDPVMVKTDYVKTGVYNLSDYIKNYDELVDFLRGTPYEQYLPTNVM